MQSSSTKEVNTWRSNVLSLPPQLAFPGDSISSCLGMHPEKDSDTEKVQPLVSILTKKALYDWSLNAVNGVIRGQEASVVVLWSTP
jgi:hypothetical protein